MIQDEIRPHTDEELLAKKRIYVEALANYEQAKRRNEVFAEHKVEAFQKPTPAWKRYPLKFWRWGATATALWSLPWIGE